MSEENFHYDDTNQHPADLNISSYFWYMGCDWSPCIRQEIIEDVGVTEEEYKPKNDQPLILAVAGILAILSIVVWMRANQLSQTLQQASNNSVQQVITAGR